MLKYENVNPTKLHSELISVGINPVPFNNDAPESGFIGSVWFDLPEGVTQEQVNAIVAVHDTALLPPQLDPDEELAAAITAATTLDQLKNALLGKVGKGARAKGKAV